MSSFTSVVLYIFLVGATTVQCLEMPECVTANVTCADCYNHLAHNTLKSDENQYNLTRAFFPPDAESVDGSPVSVIVYYTYEDDSGFIDPSLQKIWFWTASAFYHFQPLGVLQFTSLFFADPSLRIQTLYLTLHADCANVSEDYMRLLTQRLQLYAMDFSIYPKIPSDYFPKADNSTTIEAWNDRNSQVSDYLTSYQIIVPLVVLFFSIVAISYFLFSNSQAYHDTVKELIDSKTAAGWELRTNMYIVMAISFTFSGYVFCMDIAAAVFRAYKTRPEFQWFSDDHCFGSPLDQLYHLTTGLMVVDILLFILCSITLIVTGVYNWCKIGENNQGSCCGCGLLGTALPWYTLVFPSVNLAAHADQIIIGFIRNPYHATGVSISYGAILVICVALLRFISHLIHACMTEAGGIGYKKIYDNYCVCTPLVIIFIIMLVFVILSSVYFIALYFLLPISGAIDDAPNRILTIYQSIVVIFAAYFTYWVVVKKQSSPLDFLIKAKDTLQANKEEPQRKVGWTNATYEMKVLDIAGDVLKVLEKAANYTEQGNGQQVEGDAGRRMRNRELEVTASHQDP